jgi:hypothetical protein
LPCRLVAVVGVDELVVVDAVRSITLDVFDCRFAAVEGDDVVDEGLAGWREEEGFRWVVSVVSGGGLADFELLAWSGGVLAGELGGRVDLGLGGVGQFGGCD